MTDVELKKIREATKLSQVALASLMGVSQSRVSEWESGARPIPKYIEKLIDCLFKEA